MPETAQISRPIRHVVFFSCKNPDDIDRVISDLQMLGDIPDLLTFEVSRNKAQDRFSNEVDIVVYAEFADESALATYRNHDIYEACIQRVRPLRDLRIAADF